MARINLGSLVTDITGSVGTETYSRNQGGAYVKERAGPSGPPSANQLVVTTAMTDLSREWSGTLTEAQRKGWREYASRFPRPNTWGQRSLKNGYTRFIAVNFPNYENRSLLFTANAPTDPPLSMPIFELEADSVPPRVIVFAPLISQTDLMAPLVNYTYIGVEQNPGVSFYKSPFVRINRQSRTLGSWQSAPMVIPVTTGLLTTGQKIWVRIRVQCSLCFATSPLGTANAIIDA